MVAPRLFQGMNHFRQLAPPASQAPGARAGVPSTMGSWAFEAFDDVDGFIFLFNFEITYAFENIHDSFFT